jgi:hypothetical protein
LESLFLISSYASLIAGRGPSTSAPLERVQVDDVDVVTLAVNDVLLDGAAGLLAVGGRGWRQGAQGQR